MEISKKYRQTYEYNCFYGEIFYFGGVKISGFEKENMTFLYAHELVVPPNI